MHRFQEAVQSRVAFLAALTLFRQGTRELLPIECGCPGCQDSALVALGRCFSPSRKPLALPTHREAPFEQSRCSSTCSTGAPEKQRSAHLAASPLPPVPLGTCVPREIRSPARWRP